MIASPTLPETKGYGRFLQHGRAHCRPHQQSPEVCDPAADQSLDIFGIARQRAREFGRTAFVISHWNSNHWNVVFADTYQVSEDDVIEYVAYSPFWFYQAKAGGLDWFRRRQATP